MSVDFYKPLTPDLRKAINTSIDNNIDELKTCNSNAFVNMQLCGQITLKQLINSLPDGYPMPMTKNER